MIKQYWDLKTHTHTHTHTFMFSWVFAKVLKEYNGEKKLFSTSGTYTIRYTLRAAGEVNLSFYFMNQKLAKTIKIREEKVVKYLPELKGVNSTH